MAYEKKNRIIYWITPKGKKIPVDILVPNAFRLWNKMARKVISSYWMRLSYDFSSVQCDLPRDIADEIYEWGLENIPNDDLIDKGREGNIHVTVKYGLHGHDPFELRPFLADRNNIKMKLGNISLFNTDECDVIKLEVDSPGLIVLNKLISNHFDHTDTYPDYVPHITIAYVKKGKGKKYDGRKDFAGRKIILDSVLFSGNDNRKTVIPFGQGTVSSTISSAGVS